MQAYAGQLVAHVPVRGQIRERRRMAPEGLEIGRRESGLLERRADVLERNDELFGMGIRQRLEQDAVDDTEDGGVGADSDRKRRDRHGGKSRAATEVPKAVSYVLTEHVEMLTGRGRDDAADRVTPQSQKRHRSSSSEYVLPVLAECLRHLVSEVAAKLRRKEPQ